ncbi:protein arginine kinase [Roseibacillus persicicus]|uniref:Protein-arginine kinase n=1 Tax=Roseibacillus persicicus TaxID=454148 RepID=A0A918TK15_9BACT|nr:protein arginine kinase [Roseibacillus persicicus]MDQ8189052.1 protein arginine kinase [Roseibacillus persicicus]GHC52644.1 protein-arginine kinase [Roseibacillus persicicus]
MMRFSTLLKNPADWMANDDESNSVVLTSRVRLARNIAGEPFPGWAKKEERVAVLERVRGEVEALPGMKGAFSHGLEDLSSVQKQVLVERHLISREQAARSEGSAAIVNRKQTFSLMLNEEDHLRMQSIRAGLSLTKAFEKLSNLETELSRKVPFAFDGRLGYLTACPTNVGTGMRASAMLHLPGLVLSDEVGPVLQGVARLRLAVRGFYGEGTESLGNLFQVSNQSTLGESEGEIISRLERVIRDVETHELNARQRLMENDPQMILDQVGRAYGVLKYSHIIASKEALNLLSLLRLGAELGFFEKGLRRVCDLLLMDIQPAHLQLHTGKKLDAESRDSIRSEIIRGRLQTLEPPAINPSTLKERKDSAENKDE